MSENFENMIFGEHQNTVSFNSEVYEVKDWKINRRRLHINWKTITCFFFNGTYTDNIGDNGYLYYSKDRWTIPRYSMFFVYKGFKINPDP